MREFAQWLVTSTTVNLVYTFALMAVMVLPMVGLAFWYHRGIRKTEGGRRLMQDQNSSAHRPTPRRNAGGQMRSASALHSAIMSGRYGSDARRMQIEVYKVCAVWLTALALLGVLPFAAAWIAAG